MRDALEVAFVVAVGGMLWSGMLWSGMLWSVVRRLRRGEVGVVRSSACGRPCSNAYSFWPPLRGAAPLTWA